MVCQHCGAEMKTIPAGVSKKTGKPYNAFTACPNKCQQQRSDNYSSMVAQKQMVDHDLKKQDEKWADIGFGKCKHAFLIEAYRVKANGTANDWLKNATLDKIEEVAEQWAAASMRRLSKEQEYVPVPLSELGQVVEQVPEVVF